jgi:tripartite ATP-independent transporter DctP family solute receptor
MTTDKGTFRRGISRRTLLATGAALPFANVKTMPAHAAEFTFKLAHGNDVSNPVHIRALEAAARIKEATAGRMEVRVFPGYQLGSDTDTLSQVRSGGIEMLSISATILATLVPVSSIVNTGFAFPTYDRVWQALDGKLGIYVRDQIKKSGLFVMDKMWDNGFRQITSSTREIKQPQDLKNFRLRVPPSPMLTSLFQALGAAPAPINFNELYTALQTKIVDGQENALQLVWTSKLYEVQKSVSLTSHVWDGYWILGNRRAFQSLPADIREIVQGEFDRSAVDQRNDNANLNASLRADLAAKGISVIEPDISAFRKELGNTTFYKDWQAKFGEEAWSQLVASVGQL